MALVTDLLQALGVVNLPFAAPGPEATLNLRWPDGSLQSGPVQTTSGSLDRATSPRPRVVAFVAPETTVRGLALAVLGWLETIPAAGTLPEPLTIARALLAYHRADLGLPQLIATGVPSRNPTFAAWTVGRGVRLPIEVTSSGLVTDLPLWTTLAGTADPSWDALLDLPPQPLDLPDPDADRAWAAGLLAAHPTIADAAPATREELLLNPSRAVYQLLALLAAVDGPGVDDPTSFWTALVNTALSPDELTLLAAALPGSIVLRALYRRLSVAAATAGHDPSIDTAITNLNAALGVAASGPVDLNVANPTVVPQELPTSLGWQTRPDANHAARDATGERTDGQHQLVLGRSFYAGRWAPDGRFTGPAYEGTPPYAPQTYAAAHPGDVDDGGDPRLAARFRVMELIAPNEGYLDSIRLRDKGIVSIGVQQWTVHVDTELNVLLWDLLTDHPDDFDAHLGVHGLRLTLTASWPAGTPDLAGRPRTVTLGRAVPGGVNVPMPAPDPAPDQPDDRLRFFGGAPDPQHAQHFVFGRPALWAGWLRSASHCSQPLRVLQLRTAANRFGRILAEGHTWTVGGTAFTIDALVTSEQGAALLLDQHINAPGYFPKDVQTAVNHVSVTPATDANGLTTAWLTAFETQHRIAIRYLPSIQKLDITVDGKVRRGRQSFLLGLHRDTTPHSFGGW